MTETIKYLSLINIIGFLITSIALILFVLIKPFAWGELLVGLNLLLSVTFIIAGIVILRNYKKPNKQKIQNILIAVFLILWLPSIGLPFAYEIGGLLICLAILGLGLWGMLKLKELTKKMIFINVVGMFFLLLNFLVVIGIISAEI